MKNETYEQFVEKFEPKKTGVVKARNQSCGGNVMGRQNTKCPHRAGVICDRSASCDGCGWNPEVEKRRIRAIREARKPKQQFIRQSFVPGENKNIFLGRRH